MTTCKARCCLWLVAFVLLPLCGRVDAFPSGAKSDLKTTATGNVIAFLEEQGDSQHGKPDRVYRTAVRLGFWYNGVRWAAYPQQSIQDCPDEDLAAMDEGLSRHPRSWTAVKGGQEVGALKSRGLEYRCDFITPPIGWFQNPFGTNLDELLKIMGPRSTAYCSRMGAPQRRPLLLVSKPCFKIPDGWRPAPEEKGKTAPATCASQCESLVKAYGLGDDYSDVILSRSAFPGNDEIGKPSIVDEAYVSATGERLYCVHSSVPGGYFWFTQFGKNKSVILGEGMQLLEMGDYNGDGATEFLFSCEFGSDAEGYALVGRTPDGPVFITKCSWRWG